MRMDAHFRLYGAWMHLRADLETAGFYIALLENTQPRLSRQTGSVPSPRPAGSRRHITRSAHLPRHEKKVVYMVTRDKKNGILIL